MAAHNQEHAVDAAELKEFLSAFEQGNSKAGTRAVLIVDDEPSVRRMVSRSMSALDRELEMYEAENGAEALQMFEQIRQKHGTDPVLIVTDLQMPVMDGWEFIDALWNKFQGEGRDLGVPLIVLSSSSGSKGGMFFGKSVHGSKCKYSPVVTVAKEDCIKPVKYDSQGVTGLNAWLRHFLRKPQSM